MSEVRRRLFWSAMSLKLYVGNLPFSVDEESLRSTFAAHGEIELAEVVKDRLTTASRGFGFVTFSEETAARRAISVLDGQELDGRPILVREAFERGAFGDTHPPLSARK